MPSNNQAFRLKGKTHPPSGKGVLTSDLGDLQRDYYTKSEVDVIVSKVATGKAALAWNALSGVPKTLSEYGVSDSDPLLGAFVKKSQTDTWYSPNTHAHTFASLNAKPTTLEGYGITDSLTFATAESRYAPKAHSHSFNSLANLPSDLQGFGLRNEVLSLIAPLALSEAVSAHVSRTDNPHDVTPALIGTYNAAQIDTALTQKSDTSHAHDERYYTKAQVDEKVIAPAVAWDNVLLRPTTVAGYGITNVYTKAEIDGLNSGFLTPATGDSRYYTKAQVDTALAGKIAIPNPKYALPDISSSGSLLTAGASLGILAVGARVNDLVTSDQAQNAAINKINAALRAIGVAV